MLQLRRLAQAGFVIRSRTTTLIVDAFLSPRPDRLVPPRASAESLGGATAILATHEHKDHLDRAALPALVAASPDAMVIVPAPLLDLVRALVPDARVIGARVDEEIVVGDARIAPVPARHGVTMSDAYREDARFLGYVIAVAGALIYHAGDTLGYEDQARRIRGVDIALLPINGRTPEREARGFVGNMDHVAAVELCASAGIRTLVPMHHDTIDGNTGDVAALREYAKRYPDVRVIEIAPFAEVRWPPD